MQLLAGPCFSPGATSLAPLAKQWAVANKGAAPLRPSCAGVRAIMVPRWTRGDESDLFIKFGQDPKTKDACPCGDVRPCVGPAAPRYFFWRPNCMETVPATSLIVALTHTATAVRCPSR